MPRPPDNGGAGPRPEAGSTPNGSSPTRQPSLAQGRYQLLPDLSADEFEALKADIATHGYDPAHPIVRDEDGNILDGHHRDRACRELQITPPTVTKSGLTEAQKIEYALGGNLHRRHLTTEQKHELIAAELKRDPDRSDRAIAKLLGVSHPTVAKLRRELDNVLGIPEDAPVELLAELCEVIVSHMGLDGTLEDYNARQAADGKPPMSAEEWQEFQAHARQMREATAELRAAEAADGEVEVLPPDPADLDDTGALDAARATVDQLDGLRQQVEDRADDLEARAEAIEAGKVDSDEDPDDLRDEDPDDLREATASLRERVESLDY